MEPYSIAIVLQEAIDKWGLMDARILATDINSAVLETAKAGVYDLSTLEDLSKARRLQWFESQRGAEKASVRVRQPLREMISFRQLNLMGEWPMKGPFDIIFCRNVVIYFDRQLQLQLFRRFAQMLRPEGLLILGYSESLGSAAHDFTHCGRTMYRKRAECE